jgi:putative flippase GtrA
MVVDLSAYTLLLLAIPLEPARATAIWLAMTCNFVLNRRFTFGPGRGGLLRLYILFCCSCLLGAAANWLVSVGLCVWLAFFARFKLLAAVVGVVAGMGFNYTLCRAVVFRADGDAPPPPGCAPPARKRAAPAQVTLPHAGAGPLPLDAT